MGRATVLALASAFLVGCTLFLLSPVEYRVQASVRVVAGNMPSRMDFHLQQLRVFAWNRVSAESGAIREAERALVTGAAENVLQVALFTPQKFGAAQRLRDIVEGYISAAEQRRIETASKPTEGEAILSRWADELKRRLDAAQAQLQSVLESLPESDPRELRVSLTSQWTINRSAFESGAQALESLTAELEQRRREPPPKRGTVDRVNREAALSSDLALQQDLQELRVKLTEVRTQLSNVGLHASKPLGQTHAAAQALLAVLEQDSAAAQGRLSDTLRALTSKAQAYKDALSQFAAVWDFEFAAIREMAIDPLASELIDAFPRIRTQLNDFLFAASGTLTDLRGLVQSLGVDTSDEARHHVLHSEITGAFQALQSASHRFEFAAGQLDPRDNFRLETALESARGLRRRSQHQIRGIDERLQQEALTLAKKQRDEQIADLERRVEQQRADLQKNIAEIVQLQDRLNLSSELTEGFLKQSLHAESATREAQVTQTDLDQTKIQLESLNQRRLSAAGDDRVELISCDAVPSAINIWRRLQGAGLAALMTLAAILWVHHRTSRIPEMGTR